MNLLDCPTCGAKQSAAERTYVYRTMPVLPDATWEDGRRAIKWDPWLESLDVGDEYFPTWICRSCGHPFPPSYQVALKNAMDPQGGSTNPEDHLGANDTDVVGSDYGGIKRAIGVHTTVPPGEAPYTTVSLINSAGGFMGLCRLDPVGLERLIHVLLVEQDLINALTREG